MERGIMLCGRAVGFDEMAMGKTVGAMSAGYRAVREKIGAMSAGY